MEQHSDVVMTPLQLAAQAMGRIGGSAKSEAKTAAARRNAKRPRPGARGKRKQVQE